MDKQLVNDLKMVIDAEKKRKDTIREKQTDDIIRFMNPQIVRDKEKGSFPAGPEEPKRPQKKAPPQKPTPPRKPLEPGKKTIPTKKTMLRDVDWSYPDIYPAIPILSIIMIAIGFFSLLQGAWGWILVGVFSIVLAFPYVKKLVEEFSCAKISFESAKNSAIQYNESKREQYEAELKKYDEAMQKYQDKLQKTEVLIAEWKENVNIKYAQDMKAYEAAMEIYKKEEAKYDEECERYSAICDEYRKEEEKATKLMQEFNDDVRAKAEKEFDDTLASLATYFPKKYVGEAEQLLEYIVDARADTLKEAIELHLEEKRRRDEAWSRMVREDAAAETAAQAAEKQWKIQKGMQQCSQCIRRSTCYGTADNEGNCWNFKKAK